MRFLVDTNIIINFLANREPDTSFLRKLLKDDQLFISPIVIAEYLAKCPPDEEVYLRNFIELGKIIPIDREISFLAGTYRRQFSNKTKETSLADCFLAAACKANKLTLITNNLKDYPMKDIKVVSPAAQVAGSITSKKKIKPGEMDQVIEESKRKYFSKKPS